MADEPIDEPGRETAQGGTLGALAERVAQAPRDKTLLPERTRDDTTLGPGQFEPGKVKDRPKKDDESKRKCPPGKHWNAQLKKCVPNVGKQEKNKGDRGNTGGREPRKVPPPPVITTGGGGGGGGGGTTTTTSGGGGSPPPDPNAPLIQAGMSLYFQLWGQVPPQGYIEKLVRQGMNLWEIAFNERSKPAFNRTKTYEDRASEMVRGLLSIAGYR